MDLSSLARNLLRGAGQTALNAEKAVPLYGQMQRGVRGAMAPAVSLAAGQNQANTYQNFSQPEQPGLTNAAARMVGGAAPLAAASEGVAMPLIAKAMRARQAVAPTVDLSKALSFLGDEGGTDAIKVIVDKAKTEPDSPQALTLLQKVTSQHLPDFKLSTPQEQADIWDSLMTAKHNPAYMQENPNAINPAIRSTLQNMYNRSRLR